MADGGTSLMLASLAITAIGTGMSFYSSQQAAANEQRMANYNAEIARQNAELQSATAARQAQMAQYNARLMQAQAQNDLSQAQYQAAVMESNAQTLRNYAASTEDQGREEARRMRLEKLRAISAQRSQFAKGGVTTEGSPLAVLADTEGTMELAISDMWWQTNQESKKLLKEAEFTDHRAAVTKSSAEYQSLLSMNSANLAFENALYEEKAARAGYGIAMQQAELDRMAGNSRADAYTLQGYSSIVSGAGQASNTLLSYNYNKPQSSTSKPKTSLTVRPSSIGGRAAIR